MKIRSSGASVLARGLAHRGPASGHGDSSRDSVGCKPLSSVANCRPAPRQASRFTACAARCRDHQNRRCFAAVLAVSETYDDPVRARSQQPCRPHPRRGAAAACAKTAATSSRSRGAAASTSTSCIRRKPHDPSFVGARRARGAQRAPADVIDCARYEMTTLYQQLADAETAVVLTDTDGVIVHMVSSPEFAAEVGPLGLRVGGMWSETEAGTNGMGTCLAAGGPVSVRREDHFFTPVHRSSPARRCRSTTRPARSPPCSTSPAAPA